jgi:hypothetical protein
MTGWESMLDIYNIFKHNYHKLFVFKQRWYGIDQSLLLKKSRLLVCAKQTKNGSCVIMQHYLKE